MKVKVEEIEFEVLSVKIVNRNQENIFKDNKKSLIYRLDKAIAKSNDRLNKIAQQQKDKYLNYHQMELGKFLLNLKELGDEDYKLYLNKYGDRKYCNYRIDNFLNDKGIYCYILDNKIVYVGRSKKTFIERFKEYGKITPYNCLIDGQATNCNINSKINDIKSFNVGFYLMNDSSDKEIEVLEKKIIHNLKTTNELWNVQKN